MRRRSPAGIWNLGEMRREARRIPRPLFDLIEGGAGDEVTLRENWASWDRIALRPRALADVSSVDTSATIFGQRHAMPVVLAPVAYAIRLDPSGELAFARAASDAGVAYTVHQAPSYPIEALATTMGASAPTHLWAHLYMPRDRDVAVQILDRIRRAGSTVLMVTIDSPVTPGTRQRDFRNHFATPKNPYPRRDEWLRLGVRHPRWMAMYTRGRRATQRYDTPATPRHANHAHEKAVTFDDLRWLREQWQGPLIVKGIQRADECERIVDVGVDGLVVSNHGARYLDIGRASIDILPEVVDAVGGRVELFVDGGVMRGTDVVKAIAVGARAVLVGKAYLYGMAAAGEAGVRRVLEILRSEITETMALSGCPDVASIDRSLVAIPARWEAQPSAR